MENGAHFSGEGHLIEGEIEGDVNKTIRPIVCDADGHLIIDLDASTITIGTVDQGAPGVSPWLVAIDQTGTNNNVDVNNFPVSQAVTGPLTDAQLRASPVPVTATFTPSGIQDVNIVSTIPVPVTDNGGSLTIDGTVAISGSVAVTGPLTDVQLRATPVPVSGSVSVSNFPALQTVALSQTGTDNDVDATVTNFPASQTINGTVTANAGTGTFIVDGSATIQPISGTVTVANPGLTDAELRATPVPVSGAVTTNGLTDAQLRATPVPVSGTVTAIPTGTQDVNIISTIALPVTDNGGSITVDGVFFQATQPISGTVAVSNFPASVEVSNDVGNPLPVSGTVVITPSGIQDVNLVSTIAVPVTDNGGSLTVDGVFFQAVQPVSGTVTSNIGTTGGLALDATLTNGTQLTQVTNFPASVEVSNDVGNPLPVSGTVAVSNFPAFPALQAVAIDQTGTNNDVQVINGAGAAAVNIQDGGNSITVDGAVVVSATDLDIRNLSHTTDSVAIGDGTDLLVINPDGSLNITDNGGSLTVDGTFFQAIQPVSDTLAQGATTAGKLGNLSMGAVTTDQPTYVTGTINPLSLTVAGALRVDSSVSTATVTRVTIGAGAAVTLLASRAARVKAVIFNEAGTLFVKAGSAATSIDYTWRLVANTELVITQYTGIVTARKAAGTTEAQVTDF